MSEEAGTTLTGRRLAERAREAVQGWEIPPELPRHPSTGVLPSSPDPDMLRTAARVLHLLLVRSSPETVLLLGVHDLPDPSPKVLPNDVLPTPVGPIPVDVERRRRLCRYLGLDPLPREEPGGAGRSGGIEGGLLLLAVLGPGCQVLPILLPRESDGPLGDELGEDLANLYQGEKVALVAPLEFSRCGGESEDPRKTLRQRDAELLRSVVELDRASVSSASSDRVSSPAALAAIVAHARGRGAEQGALVEYVRSPLAASSGVTWGGRAGVVF